MIKNLFKINKRAKENEILERKYMRTLEKENLKQFKAIGLMAKYIKDNTNTDKTPEELIEYFYYL